MPAPRAIIPLLLTAISAPAIAQDHTPEPPRDAWRFEHATLDLSAWYAAANGSLRLPGSAPAPAPSLAGLNLDNPRLTPALRLDLLYDNPGSAQPVTPRARLFASAFAFDVESAAVLDRSLALGPVNAQPGDRVRTRFELQHAAAGAGLQLVRYDAQPDRLIARVDALVGVHALHTDTTHRLHPADDAPPQRIQRDDTWYLPFAGARLDLVFERRLSIHLESTVGGFDGIGRNSALAWDISTSFRYRPIPPLEVGIGYRNLSLNLDAGPDSDPAKWRGALAGLSWHLTFSF